MSTRPRNLPPPHLTYYFTRASLSTVKTHRELFADFFASLFGYPLEDLIAEQNGKVPESAAKMWKV